MTSVARYNPFVSKNLNSEDFPQEFNDGNPDLWWHRRPYSLPLISSSLFTDTPTWQSLNGTQSLFDWFQNNPVFYATVMIKAREYANMKIDVVHRRTGKVEQRSTTRKDIPGKLYRTFEEPNVLQSRWEFWQQRKIMREVAGNSFAYGNFGMMPPDVKNLLALWNVWPQYMNYKLGKNYFEATNIDDIILGWKFEMGNYLKEWDGHEILHSNAPNVDPMKGLIFGQATALSLIRPLSNIDMAYESRNVIMKNRGMRVIISSGKKDANANLTLMGDEGKAVKEAMKNYGMREGQKQFFFSESPLTVVPIDQDVSKLGLFEEIQSDSMMVGNAFGVPATLLSLTIKGATYENQEASVRRLYQGALIPEADDDIISMSNFMNLEETDWMVVPNFDQVPALQQLKENATKTKSERLLSELGSKVITIAEYREQMGYGPMIITDETIAQDNAA